MCTVADNRETQWKCRGKVSVYDDSWQKGSPNRRISSKSWTGATWFFPKQPLNPDEAELKASISNAADQQKRFKPPPKGIDAVASIVHSMSSVVSNPEALKTLSQGVSNAKQQAPPKRSLSKGSGSGTMFEFCCDPDSMLGRVNEGLGINHFRLTSKNSNMADSVQCDSLLELVAQFPGCDLWGSIPCSEWSSRQPFNSNRDQPEIKKKLKGKRRLSIKMLRNFIKVAEQVLCQGGTVSFEWPKNCSGWSLPLLLEFVARHGLYEAITDGCAHGMKNHKGEPLNKSWRIVTSSFKLAQNLSAKRCGHEQGLKHAEGTGNLALCSASRPENMAQCIAQSLYGQKLDAHIPCMPTVPTTATEHVHNELSPEQQEVLAGVHMLLDRKDWHKHPGAQEAIDKEASGLLANDTWSYDEVVPREELMKSKTPLNIGRVMTILSIKHWETPELRKLKARIVFRGDDIRDQDNNLAVLQELKVNPSGLTGINFNLAYGAMKGHKTTQSDVVRAYTQSYLQTKVPTWVELPAELTPPEFKGVKRPCVRLQKSLYGHPESGYHWDYRFKQIMKVLGGKHVDNQQSTYWFEESGLLLSLYVDDIVLSGPSNKHAGFWSLLQTHLEIEEPSPVDRVLGRKHLLSHTSESTTLRHDMSDFCQNCCELYEQLSGRKLKEAATPFDSNIQASDFDQRGFLAESASRILMKVLWCARLSRPDLMKPISDLTRKVACWSFADDKRLYKLMCYLHATPKLSLTCKIADNMEDLRLGLYTDADHSSEMEHTKSTSGSLLVLEGPNSWWPLSWASKKQTATSRSTTEAEIISLASGLFGEALPMQELAELVFGREVDLHCYQDNSAVIQIVQSGYSPKLRHVSKTHRINLSSLYEVFEDPHTNLGYIATDKQCADVFTKALTPVKFPAALQLLKMQRL